MIIYEIDWSTDFYLTIFWFYTIDISIFLTIFFYFQK